MTRLMSALSRAFASPSIIVAMLLVSMVAQERQAVSETSFLFIDAAQARSRLLKTTNFSKIRDRLAEAGNQGFGLVSLAGSSSSANVLLKRDAAGPRTYRLIFNGREGSFLNDLNKAASDGLRVVPGTIKAFEDAGGTTWMAVVAPVPDATHVTYVVVKGTEEGEKALDGASAAGRLLVGILGRIGMTSANTLLFFEQHAPRPSTEAAPVHRIIANSRTSTTEKDIVEAAAGGFRLLGTGFGYMCVVMSRSNDAANEPTDYRLLATTGATTALDELNAAGADGFRLSAMSEHGQEGIMVLHRKPGSTDHFEYQLLRLEEDTANRTLLDAENHGYQITQLFSDIVVLERRGHVDGSANTAPGIVASQVSPEVALSTLHAPRNSKQTPGTDVTLDEVKREKGLSGTKIAYRVKTSGFPRDKPFTFRISSSAEPKPLIWLTGIQADDSGSLVSATAPNGRTVDVSKVTAQVEGYYKGEFFMLEIINEDGGVYAADRVYPFPIEAKDGSCHLWAELVSKDRKNFAIFGSGFGPDTEVKTVSSEDGGTHLKEGTTRVGQNDVLVVEVQHRSRGGQGTFAASGQHCQVTLQYEFGRQAKGPQ